MPAMTAREFVDLIAVPTVEEFMRDPSQRRGYLASLAAYHVGDYLKPAGKRQPDAVHAAMENELGTPFRALQRMATALKHREKVEKGAILMQTGSDTVRPPTGWGRASPGNPMRFDDGGGGRWVEDSGRRYDMLDLCLITLRAYARPYPTELAGSSIDQIRYNTTTYPKA